MSAEDGIRFCEELFAEHLRGHRLMSNAPHLADPWLNFERVGNAHWFHDNTVLIGDAAHTAHFSIGSGTKLALEDAIAADNIDAHDRLADAFAAYEDERRLEVLRLQSAARNSTEWFENVGRYTGFEPTQFAYSLLTRSQRVSHENLRLRDRTWLEGVEAWLGRRAPGRVAQQAPAPPMFLPFSLRSMALANRVVVSPMAMYSAADGVPSDLHLVHLGARAQGGAGLVFTEMTCVTPEGRITPGCAGLYDEAHVAGWRRIVEFVHRHTSAKIGLQLGHSGPKGATKLGWEGMDQPLEGGDWAVMGPSAVPWSPRHQRPREMTGADRAQVLGAFVGATEMAERCGFDMIELHCAHGYLLSAFITPLTNRRGDRYGGSPANRLRYPLEVFTAMRAAWPADKPMSVRISATDWVAGDIDGAEAVDIARAFKAAGADIIDVSAGQTSVEAEPVYGRMFQTPFSDRIRNEVGVPTLAVGNIFEVDHVNSIIAAGRADLCCLARPHLADPYWTLHAAAQQGHERIEWPAPYLQGREQYERNLRRAAEMAIDI